MRRARRVSGWGRGGRPFRCPGLVLALLLLVASAPVWAAGSDEGRTIAEIRFVYRNMATGAERPVDSPPPNTLAQWIKLKAGGAFSRQTADEDLKRLIADHKMVCLAVQPERVPDGVRVTFVFEEVPLVWQVRIVAPPGAPPVESTWLMEKAVKLRSGERVTFAAIEADRGRIEDLLKQRGYYFASVAAWDALLKQRAGYANVVFEVDAGPKVQPERITITGNTVFSRDRILGLMGTEEDTWCTSARFSASTFKADLARIRAVYRAHGWRDVDVTAGPLLLDPEYVEIRLDYRRQDGRRVVTGLRVEGPEAVAPGLIRRRLLTRPGRPYSRARLEDDVRWLRARYYRAGFRAHPEDVNVRVEDLGGGNGRATARLIFSRAWERVAIDFHLKTGPGGRSVVDRVVARTTGPYTNQDVTGRVSLRPGTPFTRAAALQAARPIAALYAGGNYALTRFGDKPTGAIYRVEMAFTKRGPRGRSVAAHLRIRVREGEQYRVGTVSFRGVKGPPSAGGSEIFQSHLRDRLRMRAGAVFTDVGLAVDLRAIGITYEEAGYADVEVDEKRALRPDRKVIDVTYVVKEGPLYRINIIRPRGNVKTQYDVIVREMTVRPEQRYDIRKLQDSARRLRNLRFFEWVAVKPVPSNRVGPDGQRYKDLEVQVREAQTRHAMFGIGASSVHGLFGELRYQDINFDIHDPPRSWDDFVSGSAYSGAGQTFALYLRAGSDASELGFHWHEPWLDEKPVELGLSGGYLSRDWDEYTLDKLGGEVTLGKRFQRDLTGFVGLRLHRADVTGISRTAPTDVWDDRDEHFVAGLFAGLSRNTLDNRLFPTQGAKWSLLAELVGTPFLDALKLIAKGRWYHTVHEAPDKSRQVFALWGNVGLIAGADLPVFERLYAGGWGSVRGFATHGISPLSRRIYVAPPGGATVAVARGDPIGGKFKMEGGLEYHVPIIKRKLRGLVFLDAGSVARNSLGIGRAFSDLRISTGIGLELIQFGHIPMGMYLGFPLKKVSGDETETFSFTLGFYWP